MLPKIASSEELMRIAAEMYQQFLDDDFDPPTKEGIIIRVFQDLVRAYELGQADQKAEDDDTLGEFMRGEDN